MLFYINSKPFVQLTDTLASINFSIKFTEYLVQDLTVSVRPSRYNLVIDDSYVKQEFPVC